MNERASLGKRILDLLARPTIGSDERDALMSEVARFQFRTQPAYARLCRARGIDFEREVSPFAWPAVPTDLFRHFRIANHPTSEDVRVFRTSGTTQGVRGAHFFRDLTLYDKAAERAAREMLFDACSLPIDFMMLAPAPGELPDSSLSYMLGRFAEWFGASTSWPLVEGSLDLSTIRATCDRAVRHSRPLAICGTSFALVHAIDQLAPEERWSLPKGSVVMPTGGFKGRSRSVEPNEMRSMLEERFGTPPDAIIGEYGMTELSSQMYECRGRLRVPSWMRVTPVDSDRLLPVEPGEVGILRIDDLANLDSAVSIQTSDLGRVDASSSIELLGRAPGATARGCSLTIEEMLG